ncbi:ferritin-like domain-containing protein [Variovorax sp. PAMC26660]|uniref:ferritin-like domain-containing protein n=1 Tax=Variovorax sp. PAMC26660 TaxID=2762322 RepID=UPI00164ED90C|nr:ferritin-like domain-containing protein [Variovorax sp. PAMC26660]QNK67215.1 ferritin-like domain-containing protein [Variovorax sp. PAMC26660]
MQPSLLEEIPSVPNPYPVVSQMEYPEVWRLCTQAREMAWDPAADIDYTDLRQADLPPEVRQAGAEWWSLRAWMEHGATPYGAERLRDAIFGHQPFEIKQHITNFIAEEFRHHEASFRIAEHLGAYEPTPRADYFRDIIPRFHDEKDERAMSFFAGLSVNTLFEQLSGELLQARYENARFGSIREACRLILRDEARHIQFGRIIMRRFFSELPADEKKTIGIKVAKKLRGSLLNGVYAVVNLPEDERRRSGRNRALAADHGLGATHPDEEMGIIKRGVDKIREDIGVYGVEIPFIPELDGAVH